MKDGGPAFPHEADYIRKAVGDGGGYEFKVDFHPGMSLRVWFAGQALGAKTVPGLIGYEDYAPEHRAELIRRLVRDCYEIADAMLAAREPEPTTEPTEAE